MTNRAAGKVAILWPGTREARKSADLTASRYRGVAEALQAVGLATEPAVYADEFADEVRDQLMRADGVLVWVNPIEAGRDRSVLDAMLREVAAAGVFVSAHPDVILKMGTKEVLYRTRGIGWGSDVDLYTTLEDLRERLPERLVRGEVRVLKQYRGNGGNGVWKIEHAADDDAEGAKAIPEDMPVRVRHALRGCVEERVRLGDFIARCETYFHGAGRMVDQAYQECLAEGMIRCYLVHDRVEGFGFQAINALCPAPTGSPPEDAPPPGPRLYYPADKPEFQAIKRKLEDEWIPALLRLLQIEARALPVIWDVDFLYGPKDASGVDTYALCEINVSSVYPFPDSALPALAQATRSAVQNHRARHS
ncbi:MAG: hypothetical protein AMXMBFR7_44730 [Planctomycetota bacterium]